MAPETIVSALAWGFTIVGGSLVAVLTWFAMRIVSQLDRITELFTTTTHKHDIRLTRLEERQGLTRRSSDAVADD